MFPQSSHRAQCRTEDPGAVCPFVCWSRPLLAFAEAVRARQCRAVWCQSLCDGGCVVRSWAKDQDALTQTVTLALQGVVLRRLCWGFGCLKARFRVNRRWWTACDMRVCVCVCVCLWWWWWWWLRKLSCSSTCSRRKAAVPLTQGTRQAPFPDIHGRTVYMCLWCYSPAPRDGDNHNNHFGYDSVRFLLS